MSADNDISGHETKVLLYIRKAIAGESQGALAEISEARAARDRALAELEAAEARLADAQGTLNGAGGRIAEIDAELATRGIDADKLLLIDRQMDEILSPYIGSDSARHPPHHETPPEADDEVRPGDDGAGDEHLQADEAEEGAGHHEDGTLMSADSGWQADEDDGGGAEDEVAGDAPANLPEEAPASDPSLESVIQARLASKRRPPISLEPDGTSLEDRVPTRGEARENVEAFLRKSKSDLPDNITRQVMDADEVRREMPARRQEGGGGEDQWGSARSIAGRRGGNGDI